MGIRRAEDVNDPVAVRDGGLGYQQNTRFGRQRFSSACSCLRQAKRRRNLDFVTLTDLLRIAFEGKRATSVLLRNAKGQRSVRSDPENILSAGAIQTPKLLQPSGIGLAGLLQSPGVEVVADSSNVGEKLREHRHVDLRLKVRVCSQNQQLSGLHAGWSVLRTPRKAGGHVARRPRSRW